MKATLFTLLLLAATAVALMPSGSVETLNPTSTQLTHRLPQHVRPEQYDILLNTDMTNLQFSGIVKIQVDVQADTKSIILHSNGLIIDTLDVFNSENNLIPSNFTTQLDKHFLIISTEVSLAASKYRIEITFEGELSDDMYGFYKSTYVNEDNTIQILAATQFQPTHARRAFPCWDEPEFKAKFKIAINTPNNYNALSNTPLESRSDNNGWKLHEFQETNIMSTYLIAFVVSDFASFKHPTANYNFTAWARSEAISAAEYSQEVGPKLVDYFETYTNLPYTFPKIDQVALPDFAAGAMENWGLITYRESMLLYYDDTSTESNKKSIALVVAHELAHMWFGNLVTLKWWQDTWLNEGFAQYFQFLSLDKVETDWRLLEQFVVDHHQAVFATDALSTAQSLSSESNTPAQIQAKFSQITYSKGASVLRMLSHILTMETFQKGLSKYLNKHQSGNTVPDDLFNALEEQRIEDDQGEHAVPDFFRQWTTQPGYPVLNVERNGNVVTVSQERFLLKPDESADKLTWWVPLTWTQESKELAGFENTQPTDWLLPTDISKDIPIQAQSNEWIIFNIQETGYYRVNYDPDSWQLILQGLHESPEKIHVLNRAQLVDDALTLARTGKLDYTQALELADYLKNEEDYIPWASAFNAFSFLDRRLQSEEGHSHFKTYIINHINKTYETLGFEELATDTQTERLHRVSLLNWACRLQHEDCLELATKTFRDYYNGITQSVPPNLRTVVYCTGLKRGGKAEWSFLWNQYSASRIATEKVALLNALGCTEDETILEEYLQKSIDEASGIKKQDASYVFSAVYSNPKGVDTAFKFLTQKHQEISAYYGGMNAVGNILTGIAGRLTTQEQVNNLENFINDNIDNLGSAAVAGQNAVEAARADMAWTNTHKDVIINWFREKNEPTTSTTPVSTTPPSTSPPSITPPSTTPPSITPPSTTPPSITPPSTTPASTTVPSTSPPSTTPPVVTSPPSTTPPVVTSPPSTTPPEGTSPPSTTPPVVTSPPSTTPPVVTSPPSTTPPIVTPPPSTTPPLITPPLTAPPTTTDPTTTQGANSILAHNGFTSLATLLFLVIYLLQ